MCTNRIVSEEQGVNRYDNKQVCEIRYARYVASCRGERSQNEGEPEVPAERVSATYLPLHSSNF